MGRLVMTEELARAAAMDAANAQMRRAGRSAWNEEDANLAAQKLADLWPLCQQFPDILPAHCGCRECRERSAGVPAPGADLPGVGGSTPGGAPARRRPGAAA